MRISIVTISFDQKCFLERALESVSSQRYPDLEHIVVDPGSTDGSRELIASRGHAIAHRVFEPDAGPADGLNKGFQLASGEVFGFLNSDDYLLAGAIHFVGEYFEAHPSCDVLMGSGIIVDRNEEVLRRVRARTFTPARAVYGGSSWLQQSTFFRASVFRKVGGFNKENRTCWDGELFLQMAMKGAHFEYSARELAAFRIHDASITGQSQARSSDTSASRYEWDRRRLFEMYSGRQWSTRDDAIRRYYQFERIVLHPAEILAAIRERASRRLA